MVTDIIWLNDHSLTDLLSYPKSRDAIASKNRNIQDTIQIIINRFKTLNLKPLVIKLKLNFKKTKQGITN